jgi:uncharacterized protein (TIGR00255 family)
MISMTGFGKSHRNLHNIECDIEIKSVNGRFLDIKCYLPRELSFYEFSIRKTTSRYLSRGSIELRVNINDYREPKLLLNEPKLRNYHDIIKQAQHALGIEQNVSLEFLLNEPGVIESVNRLDDDPLMLEVLELTLSEALETAKLSMLKEADAIRCHLIKSFQAIENSLINVGQQIQPFKDELFSNLYKESMRS